MIDCLRLICRDDDWFGSVFLGGFVLPDGCNNLKTNAPGALVRQGTMDNQPNEALVIRCLASKHLGSCSYLKGAARSLDV